MLLDPVREYSRGPLIVTSFFRPGAGSHGTGFAVDVQPQRGVDNYIRRIADFMAALYLPGEDSSPLHQIIYEAPEAGQKRAHIHIVLFGYTGKATPGYLLDLEGNHQYAKTAIPHIILKTGENHE